MTLRPFEDLIKPIEYDGETFIPIERIAELAIPRTMKDIVIRKGRGWRAINFSCKHSGIKFNVSLGKNFNVIIYNYSNFKDEKIYNQVKIVKSLIKWGFIEP